jgi:hypothetical protein
MNGAVRPVARALVAMSVSMAMLLAGGGAVNAAVESDEGSVTGGTVGEALDLPASTSTQTSVDQTCVASVTKDNPDMTSTEVEADCREVNVFSVSKSYDIPDASVKFRVWYQTRTQALWKEKHSGRFYYDGSRVWDTTSYRGYKGYHNCD